MNALQVTDLTKRFDDKTAVDHLNLTVQKGEFYGYLGPNGAGKSTSINMFVGLLQPTSGSVQIAGVDVWKNPLEAKKKIGVVPEGLNVYQRLTSREFIRFSGVMYGVPSKEAEARTEELIALLGLEEAANKLIIDYSHGMRKKTSLAAAMIHAPEVLFLDEPFEGIDPISGRAIRDVLRQLQQKGTTIFFSSHILEVVERLATRVGVIANGRLVADGTLEQLRQQAVAGSESTLEDLFIEAVGGSNEEGKLSWLG